MLKEKWKILVHGPFVSRKVQGGERGGGTSRDYAGGVSGRERGTEEVVSGMIRCRAEQNQKPRPVNQRGIRETHSNDWKGVAVRFS